MSENRDRDVPFREIVARAERGVLVYRLDDPDDAHALTLVYGNVAAAEFMGMELEPVIGKTILEAFPNLAETPVPEAFRRAVSDDVSVELGDVPYGDERVQRGIYNVRASPVGSGHVVVVFRNVTDLRAAEQAREADGLRIRKMAMLGNLLAGIAHEVRTPLGAVSSNTQMLASCIAKLRDKLGDEAVGVERLLAMMEDMTDTSRTATGRITELVGSLRRMARSDPPEPVPVPMSEVIESSLVLLRHELHPGVKLVMELGECRSAIGRPGELSQVITNLVLNAAHAMDLAGTLTIRTAMDEDQVVVEIEDEGCGIAEDNLARVFESGFTTKDADIGTGLGLAITSEIVRSHRGRIEVESEVGRGTTFRVVLPAAAG